MMKAYTYLILHDIPILCDSVISGSIVLLLSLVHIFSQDNINIISQHIGCNTSSNLTDEDETKEDWELEKK